MQEAHSDVMITTQNSIQPSTPLATVGDEKVENTPGSNSADVGRPPSEEYPHGAQLTAIIVSVMLSMFLVALDNVSCSTPRYRLAIEIERLLRLSQDNTWHGHPKDYGRLSRPE